MSFKIPEAIKVGGLTYQVQLVDEIDHDHSLGETDLKTLTIKLDKKALQHSLSCSFLHELIHTINMELPDKDVEFLAMALFQILQDNPGIFNYDK